MTDTIDMTTGEIYRAWESHMTAEANRTAIEALAVERLAEYLQLKAEIAEREEKADAAKEAVVDMLGIDAGTAIGAMWPFPNVARVQKCAGRKSEKLSRAVLAKGGVDPALLEAATERTTGKASVRITAWTEEDEEDDVPF